MKKIFYFKAWILVFIIIMLCAPAVFAAGNKKIAQLLTQASQFLCTTEYDKSIAACNEALKIEPNCSAAYYVRGFAHRYMEEYELAILDFTRTVEIDPKYAAAYYGRAISFAYLGDYKNALSDFDAAITIDPKYADAYLNRARVYYDMDEYDKAWADVHKAESLGVADDMLYRGFIDKLKEASGRNQR
jgi:tetratricopeptide (TPR) repeat protein